MTYPLVEVFWVDSASPSSAWVRPEFIEKGNHGVMDIRTAGLQVRKTATEITIAQSVHDEAKQPELWMTWGNPITIPLCAVTKVRRLT